MTDGRAVRQLSNRLSARFLFALLCVGCSDLPQQPVTPSYAEIQPSAAVSVQDADRTIQSSVEVIDALLRDSSATDGTLIIGLKEPLALRGVGRNGIVAPVAARERSARALLAAFPSVKVLNGVRNAVTHHTSDRVLRTDSIVSTVIRVRGPFSAALLQALRDHPSVDYIEPNARLIVQLPSIRSASPLLLEGEVRAWGIDSVRAPSQWQVGWTGTGVGVGLLDSGADFYGVDYTPHPDFAGVGWQFGNNVAHLPNNGCTAGVSVGGGCWWEAKWHGTGVLGLLAGRQNGVGAVGVAPHGGSSDAGVLNVQKTTYLIPDGREATDLYTYAQLVRAFNANSQVKIAVTEVTIPFGSIPESQLNSLRNAFVEALPGDRLLWIAPIGNSQTTTTVNYPARWPELLAVGAVMRQNGSLVRWNLGVGATSPVGPEVDLVAPGADLHVPWNRVGAGSGNLVVEASGTSFAAPIVAGVARLALQKYPSWGAARLRQELIDHSRNLGPAGRDNEYGFGLVDAACVLLQISPCTANSPTFPPPTVSITGPTYITALDSYQYEASVSGGNGSYAYTWSVYDQLGNSYGAGTGQSTTLTVDPYSPDFSVSVSVQSGGLWGWATQFVDAAYWDGQTCEIPTECQLERRTSHDQARPALPSKARVKRSTLPRP